MCSVDRRLVPVARIAGQHAVADISPSATACDRNKIPSAITARDHALPRFAGTWTPRFSKDAPRTPAYASSGQHLAPQRCPRSTDLTTRQVVLSDRFHLEYRRSPTCRRGPERSQRSPVSSAVQESGRKWRTDPYSALPAMSPQGSWLALGTRLCRTIQRC